MFPVIAVVVTGVELLLAMGLMSLSLSKFRIDVIMPALVVGSGVVCWARSSEKGAIASSRYDVEATSCVTLALYYGPTR